MKDWKKSGLKLTSTVPLPDVEIKFISASELKSKLQTTPENCSNTDEGTLITLMDFRNEVSLNTSNSPPLIKYHCKTIHLLLDDLLDQAVIDSIPRKGLLVTITETGNRDEFIIRYLSRFGFNNVKGLEFGMRGWLKNRYPVQ